MDLTSFQRFNPDMLREMEGNRFEILSFEANTHFYDHDEIIRIEGLDHGDIRFLPLSDTNNKLCFFQVIFCCEDERGFDLIEVKISKIINRIRIRYGPDSIGELVDRYSFDKVKGCFTLGPGRCTVPPRGTVTARFNAVPEPVFNERAAVLYCAAKGTRSLPIQFLLLWTCLEAQLGNGLKRKDFFEKDIESLKISERMYEIFKIVRGPFFHEGNYFHVTRHEISDLEFMCEISGLPACEERRRLVNLLENQIQKQE